MTTVTLKVEGMSCGGCVASVTRVFMEIPGVSDVAVTLHSGDAKVTFDPARTEHVAPFTHRIGRKFDPRACRPLADRGRGQHVAFAAQERANRPVNASPEPEMGGFSGEIAKHEC